MDSIVSDRSSARRQSCCSNSTPSPVKIAVLWKRSQGLHRFTRPNYRHRVFILTDQALSYYSGTMDRIGGIKGRIAIELVKAVEFVEQDALGLAHTLQVIYQSKKHGYVTLYITGRDPEECSDWVAAIRQACYFNQDMLMHYHPGAYTKTGWTCCQQRHKPTLGCQPTYYLLTRSSSRYAEMRRAQRHTRRTNSRPYSTPHRSSDVTENPDHLPPRHNKSNSCDNLHVINNNKMTSDFSSLSHLADTPTVSSCYTLTAVVSDVAMPTPADSHMTLTEDRVTQHTPTKRCSFEDEKSQSSDDIPRTKSSTTSPRHISNLELSPARHNISPLPLTPLLVSHKHASSIDSGTESMPSSAKKILYVGGSRSSTVSCDSREYLFHSWPRKASIEPRISNTDPEVIHV